MAESSYYKKTGLKRLIFACYYSLRGLLSAIQNESAFRQELFIFMIFSPAVFVVDFTAVERLIMIGSLVAVMVVEVINSAIECTLDRISIEHHELTGRAKDYGSLAVFMTLMMTLTVWLVLFWPKIFN